MRQRTPSLRNPVYAEVMVYPPWRRFDVFLADVLASIGPRKGTEYTLDRYPSQDGHYEPGNIRWATYEDQAQNRVNNHPLMDSCSVHGAVSRWAPDPPEVRPWYTTQGMAIQGIEAVTGSLCRSGDEPEWVNTLNLDGSVTVKEPPEPKND